MSLSGRRFIWRSWKNVLEAWELFWSSLRSLKTFECHCVLLCTTLLRRRRVTELSNLCGLAQVRAVKKSCHAALVFSHTCAFSHHWNEFDSLDLICLGCFEVGLLVSHKPRRPLPYVCSPGPESPGAAAEMAKSRTHTRLRRHRTAAAKRVATTLQVDWVACHGCRIGEATEPN